MFHLVDKKECKNEIKKRKEKKERKEEKRKKERKNKKRNKGKRKSKKGNIIGMIFTIRIDTNRMTRSRDETSNRLASLL